MPFSNEQTALFENDNQQRPDWYTYLLANGYTQTYWDDYDHEEDHVLTRKEISPYLLRYAQIHNLDSYKEDPCTFDDIADESTNTQLVITEVCKLRLLR